MLHTRAAMPLVVAWVLACAPPPAPQGESAADSGAPPSGLQEFARGANVDALNEVVGRFVEAYHTEDVDAFLELFTPTAIRMPPGAPPLVGWAAIRVDIEQSFAAGDTEITVHIHESEFSGDLAFVRGTFAVSATPADGGPAIENVGKWLNLMERQLDGSWKIARNIWNSDAPPASPS